VAIRSCELPVFPLSNPLPPAILCNVDKTMQEQDDPKPPSPTKTDDREARQWSMWIHLSGLCHYVLPIPGAAIVAPLVLWSMKKEDSPYIDEHGKEAINFQISILIYLVVSAVLCLVFIGFVLFPAVLLFQLIACIFAGLKANDGEMMRYPMNIRFL